MMTDAEYQAYIAGLKEGDAVHVYTSRVPESVELRVVEKVLKTKLHIPGHSIFRAGRNAGQEWAGHAYRMIAPPDEVVAIQAAHANYMRKLEIRQRLMKTDMPVGTREELAARIASLRARADYLERQAATLTEEEWEILAER